MMTRRAQVLQARMTIWAKHVICFNRIAALGAIAKLHKLTLLQGKFEILLFAIRLKKRGTNHAVSNQTHDRHNGKQTPRPAETTSPGITCSPENGEQIQNNDNAQQRKQHRLNLARKELGHDFVHGYR